MLKSRLRHLVTALTFTVIASQTAGCGLLSSKSAPCPEKAASSPTVIFKKQASSTSARQTGSKSQQVASAQVSQKFKLPKVNLVINPEVNKHINNYSLNNRRSIARALEVKSERSETQTVEQIFRDEGVPVELVNLAFIESNFQSEAKSPAGAQGLWQFMRSTAKYYGLKIKIDGEDQRNDVILSSLAAAKHLRDLYINYNDWYIALAAYNVGVGGIEKAMQKGKTRDFWTLVRKGLLPKETAQYVPKFVAASLILQNPEKYGFAASAPSSSIG